MTDVREETGIEVYVNDEVGDPNPGVMIDARQNRGRALTSDQARALASELIERADYFDSIHLPDAYRHRFGDGSVSVWLADVHETGGPDRCWGVDRFDGECEPLWFSDQPIMKKEVES